MTTKNDVGTVKAALDALLANTNRGDTEIVVVDAESTDGQLPILRDYAGKGLIKLIVKKCNRGEGRQIAFLESSGDYVISGVDTDDVVGPELGRLLELYHKEYEGSILQAIGVTIAPRDAVTSVGGWKPLFGAEDFDFWKRAEDAGLLRRVSVSPFLSRVRRRHGVIHVLRNLWRYADQGRTPILSWKWEPAWVAIRFANSIAKVGRKKPASAGESSGNP